MLDLAMDSKADSKVEAEIKEKLECHLSEA
jgi:hypothetical protein